MNRDARVALALLLPLVLGAAFSFARLLAAPLHVPDEAEYVAARDALREQGYDARSDALAVLPPWSLRPYEVLGELDPISGDALASRPLHRHRRLFVLVEPDPGDQHEALRERLGAPADARDLGRTSLLRFDLQGPGVAFDFSARLGEAAVRVVRRDDGVEAVACDQPRSGGFSCRGRPDWLRVTREWLLVSENADLAVWSHPPPRSERLEIEWSAVPMGPEIVLRAGHTRDGADRAKGAVRVRVLVDGEEVGVAERPPRFRFAADVLDTRRFEGRTAKVTFVVETDDEGSQHFAWDAYVVASGGRS